MDSRRLLIQQQTNIIENIIQCAVNIDSSASEHKYCRFLRRHKWDKAERKIIFKAIPGFGQNRGILGADSYNSYGSGHSEPNLISQKYNGTRSN
ncbi:hypothetical protein [Phocaeicola sp.]